MIVEGQVRGTVPVKFLPPVFTRNSRSGTAPIGALLSLGDTHPELCEG